MSLQLKSELRLRLGPRHCDAAIWRTGFRARPAGHASFSGRNGESLDVTLESLVAEGHQLPPRAALWVEDEYLYTLLLPADAAWREVDATARAQFAQLLGHDQLCVQTRLAPCGTRWICVALEAALLERWRESLGARGVELKHVRPAWIDDLHSVRDELPDGERLGFHVGSNHGPRECLAILVRREGASVITLEPGTLVSVEWERCDVNEAGQLAARIEAHCLRHADADATGELPAVCVVPLDSDQRALLEGVCAAQGWKLSRPLHSATA